MQKSINTKEYKIIADMLYQLRMARGLKQSELAEMLAKPQSFVSKYESGERRLDLVEIRSILHLLNTTLPEFAIEIENRISKI